MSGNESPRFEINGSRSLAIIISYIAKDLLLSIWTELKLIDKLNRRVSAVDVSSTGPY